MTILLIGQHTTHYEYSTSIVINFCSLNSPARTHVFPVFIVSCPITVLSIVVTPLLTSSCATTVMSIMVTPLLIISCLSKLTVVKWRQVLASTLIL